MSKINLFTCYFDDHPDPKRQEELDFCLKRNVDLGVIDQIIRFDKRPKYNDFFYQTQNYPHDVNVFANADIFFNQTLEYARHIKHNWCFALTRWEHYKDQIIKFEERHLDNRHAQAKHSQDVWIFRGVVKGVYGDFYTGIPGCDNRIAAEISRSYQLYNPCESIQAIHVHKDHKREYNIPKGSPSKIPRPHKLVPPCMISNEGRIIRGFSTQRRAI